MREGDPKRSLAAERERRFSARSWLVDGREVDGFFEGKPL